MTNHTIKQILNIVEYVMIESGVLMECKEIVVSTRTDEFSDLAAQRFYEAMRWAQKANRSGIDEDTMLRCEAQSRARLDSAVKWNAETVNRIITMLAEGTGH